MKIPPSYKITPEIVELIAKIEANRFYFSSLEVPPQLKEKLKRNSLLKSSIFSARIEGNPLTLENFALAPQNQKKVEVNNVSAAVTYVEKNICPGRKITERLILNLHAIVMKGLSPEAGLFRTKAEAIFNQAGMPVFLAPPAGEIPTLVNQLINYINLNDEKFFVVKAMMAHLIFEEIHPFVDGNGRVGRLLITAILRASNYDFGIFVPFEQFIENHREEYYRFLPIGAKEPEEYLVFMLKAFYKQTEKLKSEIWTQPKDNVLLPPRREEIYLIIKEHKMVPFDSIHRRFLNVPERTLRYDLKKLVDQGLVVKVGETSGSYYTVKRENNVS